MDLDDPKVLRAAYDRLEKLAEKQNDEWHATTKRLNDEHFENVSKWINKYYEVAASKWRWQSATFALVIVLTVVVMAVLLRSTLR